MIRRHRYGVLSKLYSVLAGAACRKESERIERGNRQITKGRDARTVTVGPSVDVCQPGAVLDQLLQHGGQERGGGRGQGT